MKGFLIDYLRKHPQSLISSDRSEYTYEEFLNEAETQSKRLNVIAPYKAKCIIYCKDELNTAILLCSCFLSEKIPIIISYHYGRIQYDNIMDFIEADLLLTYAHGELQIEKIETIPKKIELQSIQSEPEIQDVAIIMCTSGTTGKPKGVMHTASSIQKNIFEIRNYLKINNHDTILISRPLYHCAALIGEFLTAICSGSNIVFCNQIFSPAEIIKKSIRHNIFVSMLFGKKSRLYGEKQRDCYNKYISWLIEVLSASTDIRVLNAFKKVEKDFGYRHKEIFDSGHSAGINVLNSESAAKGLTLAVRLIIFIICGFLATDGRITLGNCMFILSLSAILIEQVKWTSASLVDSQWRISYIEQIAQFLSNETESEQNRTEILKVTEGNIEIRNISFSYRNSYNVFENLSFDIEGGKINALIGANGCGKSTIAAILTGFLVPENGSIKIDGMDLKRCSLKSIRKNIGIVSQEIFVFAGTIKENLLLGNPHATDNEIIDACRKSELLQYVQSLPEGWDTYIEAGGTNISGGQKQRIAIARVYLKDPPIVIFDEATASLDRITEDEVIEAWKNALKNRTAVVVTHKENVMKICDSITLIVDKEAKKVTSSQIMTEDASISL